MLAPKDGVDGRHQLGADAAFDEEPVRPRVQDRLGDGRLVVNAQDDYFRSGRALLQARDEMRHVFLGESQIRHQKCWPDALGGLQERALVRHHHHRVEKGPEQYSSALGESVVWFRQQYARSLLQEETRVSRMPRRGKLGKIRGFGGRLSGLRDVSARRPGCRAGNPLGIRK